VSFSILDKGAIKPRWRDAHPEEHRAYMKDYMRDYMRKRRAEDKAKMEAAKIEGDKREGR
jgi:hypothetical protein